jgi:hypothetical protein
MDILLIGIQMFKINNCVTLRFRYSEMYNRIYVASCSEEIILGKYSELNGLVKSPHSHKCYINMLMHWSNYMQNG